MNYQLRGLGFSFIVHLAALILVIALNNSMVRFVKPVVIDFSIENSVMRGDSQTNPAPKSQEVKVRQPELPKPQAAAKPEPIPQKAAPQQVTATSETEAESQAPVAAKPFISRPQPAASTISAASNIAKAEGHTSPAYGQGNPSEEIKQGYLKEHFAYIRNIVQKKLSYPMIARKKGWQGKVIIAFVVCPDGHAKDIKIREGSGIELLDKNAVAAVQQASPFPRPPIEAQLVIPINYRLN